LSSGLRVQGGSEGGRRLLTPKGIRPSQGVVKEAIFNILGTAVLEARVLDLFAGSGGLGIEALSRGAEWATFVESDALAAGVLRRNLDALGYTGRGRVVRADAVRWLEANGPALAEVGIVLLDPPYNDAVLETVIRLLDRFAGEGATVVAEHAPKQRLPELGRLRAVRGKRYGDSFVTVFRSA